MSIVQLFDRAVDRFGDSRDRLLPLAERRYDPSRFSGAGQYDWLSAQLLYSLYRLLEPRSVIEFSSNTGYSTAIQAMALVDNGHGGLRSVEIDPRFVEESRGNLRYYEVEEVVDLSVGDAMQLVPAMVAEEVPDVLFVDSMHSRGFAHWYLAEVVSKLPPHTLVHVHDIMPKTAEVRVHGWPPFPSQMADAQVEVPPAGRVKTAENGTLVFDGNYFGEAIMLTDMLDAVDSSECVFVHDLRARFPGLDPGRYDHLASVRTDANGRSLEWNESLWTTAGALVEAGRSNG